MARTSQADARISATPPAQHAAIRVQYKGTRARTLQTTKQHDAQAGLTHNIIEEFLADLEALKLTLPGLPMVDIRIVWGTGQVRAGYGLKKDGPRFNVVIKYLVKRASTLFFNQMSDRSIARLWYIEDGSPVEIDKLPLRLPPSLRSLRSPNAPSPTGSSDNSSDVSSSSQRLVASSSRTLSYCPSPAQPSLASCMQPHTDRLQAYTSAQRVLPVAKEFQAHQAPPLQSLQASAPSNPHQTPCEPPPHPVTAPPPSNGKEIRRYPRRVGLEETIRTAGSATALSPHQLSSKALASSTISSKPLAPPDSARSRQPLALPPVYLTSDACARLMDHADDAVLSTFPVLRVLVLRSVGLPNGGTATKSHEAFLTDGREYVWLAFTSSAVESFGDRDDRKSLQVGSAVRLKRMSRVPSADICPILVHDIEIIDSISDARSAAAVDAYQPNSAIRPEISWSSGAGLTIAPSSRAFNDCPPDSTPVHNERAALLLADAKFQEERRRRILLERALADVCGDLHRLDNLYPAAAEALRRIDRLADAAMSIPD